MALTQVKSDGIATGAVTATQIAANAVTVDDISDGSISTAKLADDAVTADKLADTAVTAGSYTFANVTVDAQGRITAASSGTVSSDAITEGNTTVECVDTGSNGHITFDTEGSEAARFDSSGRLLVGTASNRTGVQVQLEGTSYATSSASLVRNENTTGGPFLWLGKSRGTADGSFTVVQNGDGLGTIDFSGSDGSVDRPAARIQAFVDGTPGSNDMPGRLVFSTTADGAGSTTERMRITSDGYVSIGGGVTNPANPLVVNRSGSGSFTPTSSTDLVSKAGLIVNPDSNNSSAQFSVAKNSNGHTLLQASNGSGSSVYDLQLNPYGNIRFNSGYGSAATAYGVRAWINFNGVGTVSINNSRSVSSVTDQGTGIYNVNLSITLPDTNGVAFGAKKHGSSTPTIVEGVVGATFSSTSVLRVISSDWDGTYVRSGGYDSSFIMVGVIR